MTLTLRSTGLSSAIDKDRPDYIVLEDSRAIGRIYEERATLPELRWFWSITIYMDPRRGHHRQRPRRYDRRSQGAVPGQLAKVPNGRLDCAGAYFYVTGAMSSLRSRTKAKSKPTALRTWSVILIRSRGHFLGFVEARDAKAAEANRHPPVRAGRIPPPAADPARARLRDKKSPGCDTGAR
jgi:hypothetical protein